MNLEELESRRQELKSQLATIEKQIAELQSDNLLVGTVRVEHFPRHGDRGEMLRVYAITKRLNLNVYSEWVDLSLDFSDLEVLNFCSGPKLVDRMRNLKQLKDTPYQDKVLRLLETTRPISTYLAILDYAFKN